MTTGNLVDTPFPRSATLNTRVPRASLRTLVQACLTWFDTSTTRAIIVGHPIESVTWTTINTAAATPMYASKACYQIHVNDIRTSPTQAKLNISLCIDISIDLASIIIQRPSSSSIVILVLCITPDIIPLK